MKKLLYLFLVLPFVFSSCKVEEGCMDTQATNYNADAEKDDGSCMYSLTGVWETTSALLNGSEQLGGRTDLTYIWDNGQLGSETWTGSTLDGYSIGTATIVAGDPNVLTWSGTAYSDALPDGVNMSLTVNIDFMTSANNMTWRYVNYPTAGDTYVKTLVRSTTYSLSNWK